MIRISPAIEHHLFDPSRYGPLAQELPNRKTRGHLAALFDGDVLCPVAHSNQRPTRHVVNDLRVDVLERPINGHTGTLDGPMDFLADAKMTAVPPLAPRLRLVNRPHALTPVFPALVRPCSPT